MAIDLTIATWIWGTKYGGHYLARLRYAVQCKLKQRHRFVIFEPYPGDEKLFPGCFVRLRMFSQHFQKLYCIDPGSRVVCLDLDLIVTGELDPLFDRTESLVILKGANAANPCPFNASVLMFRAGEHRYLWDDFSLEAAAKIPQYEFPDDQGWIHFNDPSAAVWQCGSPSGIYAFRKPGWPKDDKLPADARIVAFPGKRDPAQFTHLPWVRQYWS
jgi:hypothetical protein